MGQSNRYLDMSLKENELISGGDHILVAYAIKSGAGTNVEVSTTDEFTCRLVAQVYHADEATGELRIAFPLERFNLCWRIPGRSVKDGGLSLLGGRC
jgi:ribulose-bisphosphate carboxylase large chain